MIKILKDRSYDEPSGARVTVLLYRTDSHGLFTVSRSRSDKFGLELCLFSQEIRAHMHANKWSRGKR